MASGGPGNVDKVFGVHDETAGVELCGHFLIHPGGIIQAMEVITPPLGRNINELIRRINAFQHVLAKEGTEACPAAWESGKCLLKYYRSILEE